MPVLADLPPVLPAPPVGRVCAGPAVGLRTAATPGSSAIFSRVSVIVLRTAAERTVAESVCHTMLSLSPDCPGKARSSRAAARPDSVPGTS